MRPIPGIPAIGARRCSILVQDKGKSVLVDTSPDLRAQLLDAGVERVDAVLWTHEHADQVHGIDELRPQVFRHGQIEAWTSERTLAVLRRRFNYCFETQDNGFYNPIYRANVIGGPFKAAGIDVVPFEQDHGTIPSLGFRFGRVAYANDVVALPEAAFEVLRGVEAADRGRHALQAAPDPCPSRPHPALDRADRTEAGVFDQSPHRYGLC